MFLTIDLMTSSSSSIDVSDLPSPNIDSAYTQKPSCDSNLDLSMHSISFMNIYPSISTSYKAGSSLIGVLDD